MTGRQARCAPLLLVACCLAAPARALPPEERDWDFQVAMYGWLASLDAEIEAGGVQTDVNMSFRDIFGDLGWAAMGGVEGRWKRVLFAVDVVGMQVVSDASGGSTTREFTLPGIGPDPDSVSSARGPESGTGGGPVDGALRVGGYDVHSRLTTWMLDVKPGFRVLTVPMTKLTGATEQAEDRRRLSLDAFVGFRYWNVTNKTGIEINPASLTIGGSPVTLPGRLPDVDFGDVRVPGVLLRGVDKARQETVDWFDPIIGLRVGADVTKRLSLFLSGDVGGWNITDESSDLTWQGMLGSHIALTDHVSFTGGYRALGIQRDTALSSTILHGPQIGFLLKF